MLNIVMHLVPDSNMVNYERLYVATVGRDELCKIRARSAKHAEDKLMYCFNRELPGKTLDFDLERLIGVKGEEPIADVQTEKKVEVQGELDL